jgi:putative (di)nucleoside polyphosphate hydrolase
MTHTAPANRRYRLGVGMVLLNADNQVFVAQRIDNPGPAWQMPQGGIDEGEDPLVAVYRELEEETSIAASAVELLATSRDWLSYDFPEALAAKLWGGAFKGQRQMWYLARFKGSEQDINLETDHPEFSAWKWVPFAEVPGLIVPFKRPLYELIVAEFASRVVP